MKTSFSTLGCPDWNLEQIAQNAVALGYDGVELRTHTDGNHFHPDASLAEAQRTGEMFHAKGVPVMSIKGYTRFAFTDANEVAQNQALMRKLIGVAEAMKAPHIRTFAGQVPQGATFDAMVETVGKALKPLAKEAADKGITIALETHDDWCAGASVMRLIDIAGSKGFGIVYDIFNAFHSGAESWDQTYEQVKEHICYCHLKDGYQGPDGKNHYVLVGAGDLPVQEILARFKADGYKGYFSFEWEKKWHPEIEPPERAFPHFPHKVHALWDAASFAKKAKPAAMKPAKAKKASKKKSTSKKKR
ncbi:MAG: sugar phosphate isomerase/epimerase [Planctomycetes bacterium]|nr:sugar phosphate isomerase/epimerase [Planctomycetota bacterium]